MDRVERYEQPQEALLAALEGWQSNLWTATPGVIKSFNAAAMTVVVQPTIQSLYTDTKTNKKSWINLPLLLDVIVVLQGGGGMTFTTPISAGDECLVVFASRCIDAWWQNGSTNAAGTIQPSPQSELRMHDLSDGFAIVGLRSNPRVLTNYSTASAQIRDDSGATIVDVNGASGVITLTAATVNIVGAANITGNLNVTGSITGSTVHANSTGHSL